MSVPTHLKIAVGPAEAGELVGGVSASTINRLIERGVLARVPHTDRVLIARSELDRWVASGRPS